MADDAGQENQNPGLGAWLYDNQHNGTHTTASSQTATASHSPLGMTSIGRTALGLIFIIALILLCMWLLKRFSPYKRMGGQAVKLVSGQSLGPRERVVVVEVEDTWLVLGVTQNNINLLHKLPARDDPQPAASSSSQQPTFAQTFARNLRQAASRRTRS